MSEWVAWTLLAASMQAVRTAGQKYLHESLSALTATLAVTFRLACGALVLPLVRSAHRARRLSVSTSPR